MVDLTDLLEDAARNRKFQADKAALRLLVESGFITYTEWRKQLTKLIENFTCR